MSQINNQHVSTSRGMRVALGMVLVLTLAVLGFFIAYSHLPRAGGPNSGTSSDLVTPTAVLTNAVGMLTVNRSIDFNGAQITVMQVQEAGAFSDDKKQAGAYTVRVYLQAKNGGQVPVGINYPSDARLLLPGGQTAAPLFLAIAPVVLPGQMQDGFLDFPLSSKVALSSLILRFGSGAVVAFGG
jgi:hypothetical protein